MAGDWIKFNKTLLSDPRVVRISSALKADRLRTVGGLMSAWCLFDDHTEDGMMPGYTPAILDEIVGLPGLAKAMESVGWLEVHPEGIAATRFTENNGQSAKRRAQDSVRKKSAREADKCPQNVRAGSGQKADQRREEKSNKKRASLDDVIEFATSLGLPRSDGEATYYKWEGNGWTNGNKPIKNWQATLRNWKVQGFLPSQNGKNTSAPRSTSESTGARSIYD